MPPRTALPEATAQSLNATWINHSTYLLQLGRKTVLFDPVFSRSCGPGGWLGPRRVHAPGVALEALPPLDAVLLSHDHYDHCDLPALTQIARRHACVAVTPVGNGPLLRRAGFKDVVELTWWQTCTVGHGIQIVVTPAQHWSRRLTSGPQRRLWGGFYLKNERRSVYYAGDTAYRAGLFSEIRKRLGAPELALVPIGAYEPRWFMQSQHVNPTEALLIQREVGAQTALAMHWGCFQLTDEGREEPVQALREAQAVAGVPQETFRVLQPGETYQAPNPSQANPT